MLDLTRAGFALRATALAVLLGSTGCTAVKDNGTVQVDVVGDVKQVANPLRDSGPAAAKVLLGAVAQGLLSYDAKGEVVDALAESWIVEDGGRSYIFRLKRLTWPDGDPVKAEEVAELLRERIKANPLALAGLSPEVRAMTDRVIEIRIEAALPSFLQLLAQPQFGILARSGGLGPYRPVDGGQGVIDLTPVLPTGAEPEAAEADEPLPSERRALHVSRASLALVRFRANQTDLVLGGRFQNLPLLPHVGFSVTDLRVDPVSGLFGLAFTGSSDFLESAGMRDALSRAVDRAKLADALGLPGWRTADYPLPSSLELDRLPSAPGWTGRPLAERVESARQVVGRWIEANGEPPVIKVALPDGPGASLLFIHLAYDLRQIGLQLDRVGWDEAADLRLIDEVAPFDSALWYLSRLDCAAKVSCDPEASDLLASAREAGNVTEQSRLLGEAEAKMVGNAGYIPLGQPIRWSLVGRRLNGFQPSPRGIHPLNRLLAVPN